MNSKVKSFLKILGSWFLVFAIVCFGFFTGYTCGKKYVRDCSSPLSDIIVSDIPEDDSESVSAHYVPEDDSEFVSSYDISVNTALSFDGLIYSLLGFTSSTSSSVNWSTLTSANSTYEFYRSNFYLTFLPRNNGGYTLTTYVSMYYSASEYLYSSTSGDNITLNGYSYTQISYDTFTESATGYMFNNVVKYVNLRSASSSSAHTLVACLYNYGVDSDNNVVLPSLQFVKREVGNYESVNNPFSYATNSSSLLTGHYNWIKFTDSTGFSFSVAIPVRYYSNLGVAERPMYYYNYSSLYYYDGSTSDPSNSYYLQGYTDGYNTGFSEGEGSGYNTGYNDGYNVGVGVGYNDGLSVGGDYSFLSLIGAVVDAPISAIGDMFNFNLLGINLKDFLFALFSLCIVITIVKFVLVK